MEQPPSETVRSLSITNPTGLIINVFKQFTKDYDPGPGGGGVRMDTLDQIYPNESITIEIDTALPHTYFFASGRRTLWNRELDFNRDIVDRLDWDPGTSNIGHYAIKLRSLDASAPVALKVENVSNMELSIEQIDHSVNFRRVGLLSPGQNFEGTAYRNQPHVLRDTHSGSVAYFFYAGHYTEYPYLFNVMVPKKVKATTVRFINCSDEICNIRRWDFFNAGILEYDIPTLEIGQVYELSTHTGNVWEAILPSRSTFGPMSMIPGPDEFQTFYIIDKSKSIEISFYNPTNLTLKAYKKLGGNRYLFGYIAPHDTLLRYAYPGSEWEFTTETEGVETDALHYLKANEAGTYNLTGNIIAQMSRQGSPERSVRLTNNAPVELKIRRTADKAGTVITGNLVPGRYMDVKAAIGEVLEVRDVYSNHKVSEVLIPPGEGDYQYGVEIKSLNSKQPSKLKVNNRTRLLLDLVWLDYDGNEVKYAEIKPGGTSAIGTFLTHPWLVKDNRSGRVLRRIYGYQQDEVADIYDSAVIPLDISPEAKIRSLTNRQPSKLRVNNHMLLNLDAVWLDYEGKEVKYAEIKPGGAFSIDTFLTHPWLIKDSQSGRIIRRLNGDILDETVDIYDPGSAPSGALPQVRTKSLSAGQSSLLTIDNRTGLNLDLIWLNYEGNEEKRGEISQGSIHTMDTLLTHPWLIRDSQSGRLIRRINGDILDEVVTIYESSLPLKMGFYNPLPFPVDLYRISAGQKEQLIATLSEGERFSITGQMSSSLRVREHTSQAEIDSYIPSSEFEQQFDIQIRIDPDAPDADIEVFNFSVWDLDVLSFDYGNGNLSKVADVDTRMSQKIPGAKVGQSFILQERRSLKIVGYFTGAAKPLKFNFTGSDLRSVDSHGAPVLVKNKSSYRGNLYWVDVDGNEINKGALGADSELKLEEAGPGHVFIFREDISDILLDQFVIGDHNEEIIELNPQLISRTRRHEGNLWPGEVALFTEANYEGEMYIFHTDLYSYIEKINDKIRSIRLGPGTALTVYEHTGFKGVNDVFYMDTPDLGETDVKHEMSSFQITAIAPETVSGISAISRLTEEPYIGPDTGGGKVSYRSVFRTTIQFPPGVSAVDIYAVEETCFETGGRKYTVDPVKSARIVLAGKSQLVITTEAQKMDQAIFMLRASTMQPNERFFVFQDADLYKKIAKMEHDAFVKNREKLKIKDTCSDAELMGVQTALQNLVTTMPAVHGTKSHGLTKDLYVMPGTMQYDSWSLNFGNSGGAFAPLSPEDLKTATRNNDKSIPRRNLDTEAGQFFNPLKIVSDAADSVAGFVIAPAKFISDVAEDAADMVGSAVKTGASAIATGVVDTVQVIGTTGVAAAGGLANLAGEAVNKGADLIEGAVDVAVAGIQDAGGLVIEGAVNVGSGFIDIARKLPGAIADIAEDVAIEVASAGQAVLKATIDLGNEIIEFTLDTVDKIKGCIEIIASKVFSAISGVIDYLKDLFDFGDILDTKDILVTHVNNALKVLTNRILPEMERKVEGLLNFLEQTITGKLDEIIADLKPPADDDDEEPGIFDEARDKIGWLLDKILGGDDDAEPQGTGTGSGSSQAIYSNQESDELLAILLELKDKLLEILKENGKAFINAFIDGIENLTDAITGKGNPVNRIVMGVLSIVKGLTFLAFGIIKAISAILFKLLKLIFVFLKNILNETIYIPFLSDLYKKLTGNNLTLLELLSLAIAAPTTILAKIFTGKSPRELMSPAGQSNGVASNVLTFFCAGHQLLNTGIETFVNIKNYATIGVPSTAPATSGASAAASASAGASTTASSAAGAATTAPVPLEMKDFSLDKLGYLGSAMALLGAVLAIPAPVLEEREDSNLGLTVLGWAGLIFPIGYTAIEGVPLFAKGLIKSAVLVDEFEDNLKLATTVLGVVNIGYVFAQAIADLVDVITNNNKVADAGKVKSEFDKSKAAVNAKGELVKPEVNESGEPIKMEPAITVKICQTNDASAPTLKIYRDEQLINTIDFEKGNDGLLSISESGESKPLRLSPDGELSVLNERGEAVRVGVLFDGKLAKIAVDDKGEPVKVAFNSKQELINAKEAPTQTDEEMVARFVFDEEGKLVKVYNLKDEAMKIKADMAWGALQLLSRSLGSLAAAIPSATKVLLMKKVNVTDPTAFTAGSSLHAICNLAAAGILIQRAAIDDV